MDKIHCPDIVRPRRRSADLGAFKGRVTALGGTIAYNFKVAEVPVSARIKIYREFNAKNRQEGTAGFLTLSFPLGGQQRPPPQPVVTKAVMK